MHVQESLGSSINSGNLQSCLQCGNQNQTWFLSQTTFSWLRSRLKRKKILCPVCSPTSLDLEMWNVGSDQKLTQLHPGESNLLGYFPFTVQISFCFFISLSLPMPCLSKSQCSDVQHPVCQTLVCLEEICVYLQVGVQTCLLLNKDGDYILQEYLNHYKY